MKTLYILLFLTLISSNMANAQDNQLVKRPTDFLKEKPVPIEEMVMPRYEFEGVQYISKGYYFDSVHIEKNYQIGVLREGTMLLQAFKIKDIGIDKYFVLPMQEIYQVFSSGKNTEEEEKIILSYVQDYQKRLEKEKKEAERLRRFIADNPWPFKTVFRGNTYTRTEFEDSDQSIECCMEKIGETTEHLKGDTAYPKDYLWKEGESRHSVGAKIYAMNGIDPLYYIYVDGYIYANDGKRDKKLESKLKKQSQDTYRKISWARSRHSYEYNLKFSSNTTQGFSPNTIQKMVDLEYPELDQPTPDNSLLQICALYLDINHYPAIKERGAVSGYFEVDFETTTKKFKEFNVQGHGLPIARVYDFKKKGNTNFHFRGIENTRSYILYSELIDNEISAKAKPTSKQKPDLDSLLIRLANNTYRSISYQDLPEGTRKAIELFIWESLQMY